MPFIEKVVLITGGASGIGKDCAIEFGTKGAKVAILDWHEANGLEAAEMLSQKGIQAQFYQLDVRNYEQVKSVITQVKNDFGQIDIAVNCAGVGGKSPFKTAQHTLDDWDQVIAINQTGLFYCMKEELTIMEQQRSGVVINIASIAGLRALPRQLAYVASKHAVIGMTKTAAIEYSKVGIRVNAVCPVFTNTPMVEAMFQQKEELRDALIKTIPVGRYGEVSDISNAILWLADDQSSFVTGLCLPIDGGQTA
jgi:NAD(P)-dependent dehydrogenase (short-subunit alcohol dehydrogenase family)